MHLLLVAYCCVCQCCGRNRRCDICAKENENECDYVLPMSMFALPFLHTGCRKWQTNVATRRNSNTHTEMYTVHMLTHTTPTQHSTPVLVFGQAMSNQQHNTQQLHQYPEHNPIKCILAKGKVDPMCLCATHTVSENKWYAVCSSMVVCVCMGSRSRAIDYQHSSHWTL